MEEEKKRKKEEAAMKKREQEVGQLNYIFSMFTHNARSAGENSLFYYLLVCKTDIEEKK